jgi:integrase/recombinase XerD
MTGRNLKNTGRKSPKTAKTGQSKRTDTLKKHANKRPYSRNPDSQYLTPAEKDALFKVIRSPRDRAIFRLVYHRGLRSSEPGQLQMSDWNEKDGLLYVRRGKNSISRDYRLTREEAKELRAWLKIRGRAPGPLFASQKGARPGKLGIHRNQLDRLFRKYCREAGIRPEKAHMHALKHSCATHMSERGESAEVIQDQMGHRAASSTAVYMHFSQRRRDEAAERLKDWR